MSLREIALILVAVSSAAAESFVDWNPAVDIVENAPWRLPVEPVAVDGPRVVARDGHFFIGEKRHRVWGVNLSFAANMPTAGDAGMVANRLAAAGVNAVRMHHMDTAKFPRGLWHRDGGAQLDPEGLKRLDRFIAELAKCGIRVNLNLHVGAQYSRMLEDVPESSIKYDKLYLQFVPRLQEAWRDYARMLLGHRNPHRNGVRYADDPAIAWVEVSNENSFWFGGYLEDLRNAPPFYREMLEGQFATWLKDRHRDDAGLRKAWNVKAEPLGEDLVAEAEAKTRWHLEQHEGARAGKSVFTHEGQAGVRLVPEKITGQGWHLQYGIRPLAVEKGKYYTLRLEARADRPRRIHAAVCMAHEPWGNLGLGLTLELGPEWKAFRIGFVAREDDEEARVTFSYGAETIPLELAGVKLQRGGQVGLEEGESLATGRMPLWGGSETPQRVNDRLRFLAATEKAFFDMGRRHIREELGSRALVIGTQGYGPAGLYAQDGMDFTDTHAYWQHPRFPRKPWDQGDWTIGRETMVDDARNATFPKLAAHRVPGRPFTVSEYNHPAPNDFQVECVPMMAAVAAVEDWDGVWFYTYEHNNDRWNVGLMGSFFDFRANPAKWAFMPAGALIFREGGIRPEEGSYLSGLVPPSARETWADPTAAMERHEANVKGLRTDSEEIKKSMFGRAVGERVRPGFRQWNEEGWGVVVGYKGGFGARTGGALRVESPLFCAVTVVPVGGAGMRDCRGLLVTACGRAENVDMEFADGRTTVGRNWGRSPVQAETVTGSLRLPEGQWRAWALKPNGSRGLEVALGEEDGKPVLPMSPDRETICYWLERAAQ